MTSQELAVKDEPPRVETDQLDRTYRHMEWADATIWRAALSDRAYAEDEFVRASLHHIHFVQRAYLGVWTGEAMDGDDEDRFDDAEAVARWGREAHPRIRGFVEGLDRSRLDLPMALPWAAHLLRNAGLDPDVTSMEETLHQLAAHSGHHRAQVNRRLRVLGAEPPPIDYIFWAWIGRPEPDWPV
jgi:uncharacterized damage-inducible protein DinB